MAPWQQKYFLNVRKQAQYVYQSAVPNPIKAIV